MYICILQGHKRRCRQWQHHTESEFRQWHQQLVRQRLQHCSARHFGRRQGTTTNWQVFCISNESYPELKRHSARFNWASAEKVFVWGNSRCKVIRKRCDPVWCTCDFVCSNFGWQGSVHRNCQVSIFINQFGCRGHVFIFSLVYVWTEQRIIKKIKKCK
jgi:hypothetical protein